jgi:uncharacterized protein YybS (DUF2232 family)
MGLSKENSASWRNPSVGRELAVGIAATLLFFLSVLLIPMVGVFMGIFTPLPTLLSFYRWGPPLGYWIPGGAGVAGSAVLVYLGMSESLPYFLEMLFLGLFLGAAMRQSWSIEKTIGSSTLLVFAMGAVIFWWVHASGEAGLMKGLEEDLGGAITATLQQYGSFSQEKQLLEQALQSIVPLMVRLLPALGLSSALVISWMNLMVAKRYCQVHSLPLPPWEDWTRWKAPELMVWPVIASGFMLLVPNEIAKIFGMNGLMVLGTIFLFQGLAVIAFYFEKWKLPRALRAILYAFIMLQQFAALGVALSGLFDVWFDFRRLSRKSTSEDDEAE